MTVRDLVWKWLLDQGSRQTFYLSDITKGLCGEGRRINRLAEEPRAAVRACLIELEAEGRLFLSPTTSPGRGGKPGTQITINRKDG